MTSFKNVNADRTKNNRGDIISTVYVNVTRPTTLQGFILKIVITHHSTTYKLYFKSSKNHTPEQSIGDPSAHNESHVGKIKYGVTGTIG